MAYGTIAFKFATSYKKNWDHTPKIKTIRVMFPQLCRLCTRPMDVKMDFILPAMVEMPHNSDSLSRYRVNRLLFALSPCHLTAEISL